MDRLKILITTVAGLSLVGNGVLMFDSGESVPVVVVGDVPAEAVELKEAAPVLIDKVATTGSVRPFKCEPDPSRRGEIWCFDGVDSSFYLDQQTAIDLVAEVKGERVAIAIVDGKVYAAPGDAAPVRDAAAGAPARVR